MPSGSAFLPCPALSGPLRETTCANLLKNSADGRAKSRILRSWWRSSRRTCARPERVLDGPNARDSAPPSARLQRHFDKISLLRCAKNRGSVRVSGVENCVVAAADFIDGSSEKRLMSRHSVAGNPSARIRFSGVDPLRRRAILTSGRGPVEAHIEAHRRSLGAPPDEAFLRLEWLRPRGARRVCGADGEHAAIDHSSFDALPYTRSTGVQGRRAGEDRSPSAGERLLGSLDPYPVRLHRIPGIAGAAKSVGGDHGGMVVSDKDLESAVRTAAAIVTLYGEKYWPIFERLEQELAERRARTARLSACLGAAVQGERRRKSLAETGARSS